jgi:hypothetical protein
MVFNQRWPLQARCVKRSRATCGGSYLTQLNVVATENIVTGTLMGNADIIVGRKLEASGK